MENINKILKKKNVNFFFPVAFILGIVPLIVRATILDPPEENTVKLFGTIKASSDLFSQKKSLLLMIFCIVLIGISITFFKKIFEKKDRTINLLLIASGVFWLFTLLSTIFSSYKEVALWGIFDRAEGFITITCYIILFVYSIYTFKNADNYKCISTPILILVYINAFLGFFQYAGQDLMKTSIAALIVTGDSNNKLDLLYEAGKLYGTLYHYNYVGSFVAIVFPILLLLTIFEDEDILYKIQLGIGTLLSLWLLFGSTSRAGIIGIAVSTIFSVIIFWKQIIEKKKTLLIFFITILIIVGGLNFATKGAIFERLPGLVSDSLSIFKDTSDFNYKEHVPVSDIKYDGKTTEVILPNEVIKITYENGNYIFKNSKDEPISYIKTNADYKMNDEAFKNISFQMARLTKSSTTPDALILLVDGKGQFTFNLKKDGTIHLVSPANIKDLDLATPDTFGFKGKERLGSARGYIWSRTFPLVKNNIILGGGPDTFAFKFPQNDLIGKYYAYGTTGMIVDKPHNLYLQIALNEGVIALLAFLVIMILYIVDSLRLYSRKDFYEKPQILGVAACLGVIGYLFAGIFNDSVISVAPIFWIILGSGIAINYINRTKLNKNK
ncbi:O-antigen ligase family protein [Clostridium sp. C2-6-12]|uniref:O-antigen ligase family protein n=1 Tax=Clostridium sp. C2-6-12 TaxID=2698832 RepID=UPI00136C3100|nr:O-antigen ligase family protein [Clostridium sp. C2-6-12]